MAERKPTYLCELLQTLLFLPTTKEVAGRGGLSEKRNLWPLATQPSKSKRRSDRPGDSPTFPLHTSKEVCLHCPQRLSLPSFSLEFLSCVLSVPLDSGSPASPTFGLAGSKPALLPSNMAATQALRPNLVTCTAKGPGVKCPVHTPPSSCLWMWLSLAECSFSLDFGMRSQKHGRERGNLECGEYSAAEVQDSCQVGHVIHIHSHQVPCDAARLVQSSRKQSIGWFVREGSLS